MNGFGVSPQALHEAQRILSLGSKGAGSAKPSFEETMAQKQQDLIAKQDIERMKLGAKAEEAAMKNQIALQQAREANALDFQKHKLTTEMQARQPQYTAGPPAVQSAVNNQYDSSQVPRYLGNIG